MSEIVFEGAITKENVYCLVFIIKQNDQNKRVEIPIDKYVVDHIMMYLQRFAPAPSKPVEYGNDEDSL